MSRMILIVEDEDVLLKNLASSLRNTDLEPVREPQPIQQVEIVDQTPPIARPNYSEDQPIVSKYILEERQRESAFQREMEAERKFKEDLWQAELIAAATERKLCTTSS